MDKPPFDPTQPFQPVDQTAKPPFDPTKPFAAAQQQQQQQQPPASSGVWDYIKDAVKGAPSALLGQLGSAAAEIGATGGGEGIPLDESGKPMEMTPPEDAQKLIEQNVTGPMYHAQTGPGKIGAEGLATAMNPTSWLGPGIEVNAGPRALRMAAPFLEKGLTAFGTGAGAEAGEQIAGTPGRIVGGVLGGALPATAGSVLQNATRRVPSIAETEAASHEQYGRARQMGAVYEDTKVQQLRDNILQDWREDGNRTYNRDRSIFNAADELSGPFEGGGQHADFSDLEGVRQVFNNIYKNGRRDDGSLTGEANAAHTAINHIDDFLQDATNALPGYEWQAGLAATHVQAGRDLWSTMRSAQLLQEMVRKGDLRMATTGTGANVENVLRQQMNRIASNPARFAAYSPEEQQLIKGIIEGNLSRNVMRFIGKFALTGVVPATAGAYIGSHMFGLPGAEAMAIPAAAYGVKKAGELSTRAALSRLQEAVLSNSPLGNPNSPVTGARNIPGRARALPRMAFPFINSQLPYPSP